MAGGRPPFVRNVIAEHPGKRVRVWFEDQMRFGQKGRLAPVWARRGTRPTRPKQAGFESIYLYGAVEPETGRCSAMFAPKADTRWMQAHLRLLSEGLAADEIAVLVHDGAAWHTTERLEWPANIVPLRLPPYCPELNPIERLWLWMRERFLSNRVHADYDALMDALQVAHDGLTPSVIRSVCRADCLRPVS